MTPESRLAQCEEKIKILEIGFLRLTLTNEYLKRDLAELADKFQSKHHDELKVRQCFESPYEQGTG